MKRLKLKHRKAHLTLAAVLGAAALICFSGGDLNAADYWLPVEGTGCQVWSDEPLAKSEVIRWSGGCDAGKLSGKGVLEVFDNDNRTLRFEGEMRAGKTNYIPAEAGRTWFPYFSRYSPKKAFLDRTWVLPDIEKRK